MYPFVTTVVIDVIRAVLLVTRIPKIGLGMDNVDEFLPNLIEQSFGNRNVFFSIQTLKNFF